MKKYQSFGFACSLVLALGCAGEDSAYVEENVPDDAEDIGQVEQAFTGAVTNATQFGTLTANSSNRANRISSGQVFAFLARKGTIRVCVESDAILGQGNGFTLAQQNEVYAGLGYVDNATSAYAFDYASAPQIPGFGCFAGSGAAQNSIIVRNVSLGTSTATNSTSDYGRPQFNGIANLAEGAGVVGTAQSADHCVVRVSVSRILAKGASASEDQHHMRQATAFAAAACLGMGGLAGGASNRITRTTLAPVGTETNTFSAAESCQLSNFNATANGQYNQGSNCGAD